MLCFVFLQTANHINVVASANRTLAFIRRNLHLFPINIKTTAYTTLVRPLLEYSSSLRDPHTQILINQIEMVQRCAARFCLNDYMSREAGCFSEMLKQLHLQPITRRTNRRLTKLQPVQRLSRHLNNKAFNTIHASKNCYNFSYFSRTMRDWNSLPDAIVNIPEPQHFRQALIHD